MEVDRYLRVRYGSACFARRRQAFVHFLTNVYDIFWLEASERFGSSSEKPDLHIIHSMNARPVHVIDHAGNGKDFVVYDQYLGDIFNALTRFVLTESDLSQIEAFLYRLVGQRLLLRGQFGLGHVMRLLHENERYALQQRGGPYPLSDVFQSERKYVKSTRHCLVGGQNAFAIGHEVAHVLLSEDTYNVVAIRNDSFRQLTALAEYSRARDSGPDERQLKRYREFFDHSLERIGVERPVPGSPDHEEYTDTVARLGRPPDGFEPYQKLRDSLTERSVIVDECICDFTGFLCSYSLLNQHNGMHWSFAVRAAILALLNSSLLNFFDARISDVIRFGPGNAAIGTPEAFTPEAYYGYSDIGIRLEQLMSQMSNFIQQNHAEGRHCDRISVITFQRYMHNFGSHVWYQHRFERLLQINVDAIPGSFDAREKSAEREALFGFDYF